MGRFEKFICKNWIWLYCIMLGGALTCIAVDYCRAVRGCFVIGGEVLITPILLIVAYLIKKIVLEIQELFRNRRGD